MRLSLMTRWGIVLVLVGGSLGLVNPVWIALAFVGVLLLGYAGLRRLDEKDKAHRATGG